MKRLLLLTLVAIVISITMLVVEKPRQTGLPEQFISVEEQENSQGLGNSSEVVEKVPTPPSNATNVSKPEKRIISPEYIRQINENMISGGPPKDGIPAIDKPRYVQAAESALADEDIVFGMDYKGVVKAYPQKIMYWHEIVNEEFGGEKVSITYCPLTGSVIAYLGNNLGVSGKLYNSNLVMYDRDTNSEIPQILGMGVNGPLTGQSLKRVHVWVTTWKQWKTAHPDTKVLSRETGYARDYDTTPYPGYESLLRLWFPVAAKSNRFSTKKLVFGIENNGEFLAVPKEEFSRQRNATVWLDNTLIRLEWDSTLSVLRAFAGEQELVVTEMYWFAWYAYHPSTKVWEVSPIS